VGLNENVIIRRRSSQGGRDEQSMQGKKRNAHRVFEGKQEDPNAGERKYQNGSWGNNMGRCGLD
jgi:hypothetical protein